jgi:hypothetical protein
MLRRELFTRDHSMSQSEIHCSCPFSTILSIAGRNGSDWTRWLLFSPENSPFTPKSSLLLSTVARLSAGFTENSHEQPAGLFVQPKEAQRSRPDRLATDNTEILASRAIDQCLNEQLSVTERQAEPPGVSVPRRAGRETWVARPPSLFRPAGTRFVERLSGKLYALLARRRPAMFAGPSQAG